MEGFPQLGPKLTRDWQRLSADPNSLNDNQMRETMEGTFGWYDKALANFEGAKDGSPTAQAAHGEFSTAVGDLKKLYGDYIGADSAGGEKLTTEERQRLIADAGTADAQMLKLGGVELVDTLAGIEGPKTETDPKVETDPEATAETTAESKLPPTADPENFNGVYSGVEEGALDTVAKGEGTIGLGHKGAPTREIQERALAHGAKFTANEDGTGKDYGADGFYGEVTTREISKLQKQWGLPETGIVDDATLAKLREEPAAATPDADAAATTAETAEKPVTGPTADTVPAKPAAKDLRIPSQLQADLDQARDTGDTGAIGRAEARVTPEALSKHYDKIMEQIAGLDDRLKSSGLTQGTRNSLIARRSALQDIINEMMPDTSAKPKQQPVTEPIWV